MDAAFWDARYQGADYAYGEAPNAFLASLAPRFSRGQTALVPGDGEGRNGVFLARLGLEVETLDLSAQGVEKSRRLALSRGVKVNARQADALAWEWREGAYDWIVLLYLHLFAPERRMLHARAMKALKPGGHVALEGFAPGHLEKQKAGSRGGPRDAGLLYGVEDLRDDFGGAQIERLEEVETDLREGALHVGMSAVVRLVARKV